MALTLLKTNTSSGAATSDFTSGIDSTYKLYIFTYHDVNPATDNTSFGFQFNVSSGSGFNETITSTSFRAYHDEADSEAALEYMASLDQSQGTAYQPIHSSVGNGSDESAAGELYLFNPSNTTYVKHFMVKGNYAAGSDYSIQNFVAGYINTTSAIDEISFKMASGNMDAIIKMYGVA